jgi:antitoxin (DNA-binding transcriptional repressor) of toxin-antitoxin stability system
MVTVNTHKAKTHLSALLQRVERKHETVLICRNGHPVAEMRPLSKAGRILKQNPALSKIIFHEDPSTPLSDAEWPARAR